jgi:D-lactate dehydrogenase
MVKELRRASHGERAEKRAMRFALHWAGVEGAARVGLRLGGPLARLTKRGRALPPPAPGQLPATIHTGAAAVYVPSCTNRIFGPDRVATLGGGERPAWVVEALVAVSARAGLPLWIPEGVAGSCCGLPWGSKGLAAGQAYKANEMVEKLWAWSGKGALPIVIDAASCTGAIVDPGAGTLSEENAERHAKLEILDSVAWAHDRLLPWLSVAERVPAAAVHPTCATRRLGLAPRLRALAEQLADEVEVPPTATCCGFAGDRGFSHPELTESATATEAAELSGREFDAHLCSNRTCEIGLARATGARYESFAILLERLTRSD